jgi:hypothetical protein
MKELQSDIFIAPSMSYLSKIMSSKTKPHVKSKCSIYLCILYYIAIIFIGQLYIRYE